MQRSTQLIEYNNIQVKYGACIKLVMHIILALALESRDSEQDGVANIRACVLLKLRLSANVVIVTYFSVGFALLCIVFQSGRFCKLLTKLTVIAERTGERRIIHKRLELG